MIIMMQIVFTFAVTLVTYTLPDNVKQYSSMLETEHQTDTSQMVTEFEQSLGTVKNVPLYDVGMLVFWTGNIIVDIFLNFIFALPEMITLVLNAMFIFIPIDPYLQYNIKLIVMVIGGILYIWMIISIISGIRSGRRIV